MRGSMQFQKALTAITTKNTDAFNEKYAVVSPPRSPASPSSPKTPTQFEIARTSIERGSPVAFNQMWSVTSKERKNRKGPKSRKTRKTRKSRRNTRKQRR